MPSSVGAQMSRKLDRAASELARSKRTAVRNAALVTTNAVRDEIRRVAPSGKLRGVGKNGTRVGARFDQPSEDTAIVRATGPLHLVERDTKAHEIRPKSKGRGAKRTQRKGAIRLADGSFVAVVQHPGTKGQRPFEKGIDKGRPKAIKEMRDVTTKAVRRGIRS